MNEKLLTALIESVLEDQSQASIPSQESAFTIGEKVFVRTVTYHLTGEIMDIRGGFLFLKDAAWIADSGRFTNAINNGDLNEVEPTQGLIRVNIGAIVDVYEWNHPLPRVQK